MMLPSLYLKTVVVGIEKIIISSVGGPISFEMSPNRISNLGLGT